MQTSCCSLSGAKIGFGQWDRLYANDVFEALCNVAGLVNGDGSAHSSNGSGRSRGSRGSSGGRRALHPAPEPAEPLTSQTQHGMGALPEDSDVIGEQQVSLSSTLPLVWKHTVHLIFYPLAWSDSLRRIGILRKPLSSLKATALTLQYALQDVRASRAQDRRKSRDGPGWLGTWANRQVHYSKGKPPQPSLPAHIPGTPQPASERQVSDSVSVCFVYPHSRDLAMQCLSVMEHGLL